MDRPVVCLVFEGLIGDFYKKMFFKEMKSDEEITFLLRSRAVKALRQFYQTFQLVLVVNQRNQTKRVQEWIKSNNVLIDAIYQTELDSPVKDFSQIYLDFNIQINKLFDKFVFIQSLNCEVQNSTLISPLKEVISDFSNLQALPLSLILSEEVSKPKNQNASMPLCIFVPHIRTQQVSLSLTSIFKIVVEILRLGNQGNQDEKMNTIDITKIRKSLSTDN